MDIVEVRRQRATLVEATAAFMVGTPLVIKGVIYSPWIVIDGQPVYRNLVVYNIVLIRRIKGSDNIQVIVMHVRAGDRWVFDTKHKAEGIRHNRILSEAARHVPGQT